MNGITELLFYEAYDVNLLGKNINIRKDNTEMFIQTIK
jgi:hypothetical protein